MLVKVRAPEGDRPSVPRTSCAGQLCVLATDSAMGSMWLGCLSLAGAQRGPAACAGSAGAGELHRRPHHASHGDSLRGEHACCHRCALWALCSMTETEHAYGTASCEEQWLRLKPRRAFARSPAHPSVRAATLVCGRPQAPRGRASSVSGLWREASRQARTSASPSCSSPSSSSMKPSRSLPLPRGASAVSASTLAFERVVM